MQSGKIHAETNERNQIEIKTQVVIYTLVIESVTVRFIATHSLENSLIHRGFLSRSRAHLQLEFQLEVDRM